MKYIFFTISEVLLRILILSIFTVWSLGVFIVLIWNMKLNIKTYKYNDYRVLTLVCFHNGSLIQCMRNAEAYKRIDKRLEKLNLPKRPQLK